MRIRLAAVAGLLLCAACSHPSHGRVTVSGRVLDHDGRPLRAAWAALFGAGTSRRVPVDSSGRLAFEVESPSVYRLWLVGVHHQTLVRPICISDDRPIRFEARLATPPYADPIDSVRVIGAFNGFSTTEGSVPLGRLADGTFAGTFAATSDTFAYKLLGVQPENLPLEGTDADGYTAPRTMLYGGHAGGFVSILRCDGDSVRVTFDPAALPRSTTAAVFRFADPGSRAARIAALEADLEARASRILDSIESRTAAGEEVQASDDPWRRDQVEMRARIESEADPVVREAQRRFAPAVSTDPRGHATAPAVQWPGRTTNDEGVDMKDRLGCLLWILVVADSTILFEFDMQEHPYRLQDAVVVIDFQDPSLGVQRKRVLRLTATELEWEDEGSEVRGTYHRLPR